MAKGSPNGPDKILNGVLKVFDPKADNGNGAFRPSYIAPDATNIIQGDVLLSDAIDSNDNAATGITAATPKAVKTVNDNAETKLSKTETAAQTVAGPVTFSNDVAGNKFTANIAGQDNGVAGFIGNASSANKLNQEATINIINGTKADGSSNTYSINFDGSKTTTFNIGQLDAKSLVDMVPLSSIPKAALERVVNVADETARFALTTNDVQLGDTVFQNDTGVMYLVVDDTKLNSADGYQEYKAGSAVTAMTLGKDTIGKVTDTDGDHYQVWYLDQGQPKKSTDTIGALDKPVYVKDGILTPIEEIKAGVSGVKGDYETEYRDGNVNLTYEDIPAIGIEHIDTSLPELPAENYGYQSGLKLTNITITSVQKQNFTMGNDPDNMATPFSSSTGTLENNAEINEEPTTPSTSDTDANGNLVVHVQYKHGLLPVTTEAAESTQLHVFFLLENNGTYVPHSVLLNSFTGTDYAMGDCVFTPEEGDNVVGAKAYLNPEDLENAYPNTYWYDEPVSFINGEATITITDAANTPKIKYTNKTNPILSNTSINYNFSIEEVPENIEDEAARLRVRFSAKLDDNIITPNFDFSNLNNKTFTVSLGNIANPGKLVLKLNDELDDVNAPVKGNARYVFQTNVLDAEEVSYFLAKVPHKEDISPLYLNETIASRTEANLGTSKYPYNNIYATKLNGVAESANKLNKDIQITGAVQSQVKALTVDGSFINIETSYPTGQGVVMVSETEPTDPNVLIWIQP